MTPTVQLKGISKSFGSAAALSDVSFEAFSGQIQALVGENGAGKTTLMKVLYGAYNADQGEVELHGKPVSFKKSADAIAAHIGMVSQHYSIIPELTCLENLMLGAEPGWMIDSKTATARAEELASQMGFKFVWDSPASELSPAGAQKLEILKLLWRKAEIMILDEPTAMLSPDDSDALFASLRKLADSGACIIVVTHRLSEVMEHCRTATVLRAGKKVAEVVVENSSVQELADLIVGQGVPPAVLKDVHLGQSLLKLENVTALGARGDQALKSVNLEVREGEVVGLAGVDGSGQRELFQLILGQISPVSGKVEVCGLTAQSSPKLRLDAGIRLVPEDRLSEAVVEGWSLEENAILGLQRQPRFSQGLLINQGAQAEFAGTAAKKFNTKHASLSQPISGLSGGNQQRFVAGRALCSNPRLILCFQPVRGLDIRATAEIYEELRRLCQEEKCGALVVSFDLDELLENCDRIAVICGGQINIPEQKTRSSIGTLMVGAGT